MRVEDEPDLKSEILHMVRVLGVSVKSDVAGALKCLGLAGLQEKLETAGLDADGGACVVAAAQLLCTGCSLMREARCPAC